MLRPPPTKACGEGLCYTQMMIYSAAKWSLDDQTKNILLGVFFRTGEKKTHNLEKLLIVSVSNLFSGGAVWVTTHPIDARTRIAIMHKLTVLTTISLARINKKEVKTLKFQV